MKVPGNESSIERKFQGAKRPGNESSMEQKGPGANVPGNKRARERKFRGANWPGSYWNFCSWERIGPGAKRPGTVCADNTVGLANSEYIVHTAYDKDCNIWYK